MASVSIPTAAADTAPDPTGTPVTATAGSAVRVRGLVQGVGFRPTVWRLARECALAGDVCNDGAGVLIRVWGRAAARDRFLRRLQAEPPPLARIDAVECEPLEASAPPGEFRIVANAGGAARTAIVADAATCKTCLAEINDSADRRHGYAFTNCTHCGPRLSIVRAIPYDRAQTSMAAFSMCPSCQAEYDSPADRRFHAQPNACNACGPQLWLESTADVAIDSDAEPIAETRRLLEAGYIVAIKGVGGIHLACDASNAAAVERLRRRKHRFDKPFALMARDVAMIRRYCVVADADVAILESPAAPILLLPIGAERLALSVAPAQATYGFMLAYTPLHHRLMATLDTPIVLTSGNRSDEPQCIDNDTARARLSPIADALLLHDRDIVNRVDDSVVRRIAGSPTVIRRGRGYAPTPLRLPVGFHDAQPVLALGGELKNTVCLLRDGEVIVSQHLGDLENAAAHVAWHDTLALYEALFAHRPEVIAVDAHPDYLPSKYGRDRATRADLTLETIQHHHAHIAACLADNDVALDAPPVLGIALDGTGYGDDASIWGGEFLVADYCGYRRLAALARVALPGAAQAVREPWRMAYAQLRQCFDWETLRAENADLAFFRALEDKPLTTLNGMIDAGFNSPMTSSCGRLFDAVAALVGLCPSVTYEGQAAIELEAAVDASALASGDGYPFAIDISDDLPRLSPAPMWRALLDDLRNDVSIGVIAARFHLGLAAGIAAMIDRLTRDHGDPWAGRIALSGGVFQNAVLTESLIPRLERRGLEVLRHARAPANDGGLSLGQAMIAAARRIDASTIAHQRTPSCA